MLKALLFIACLKIVCSAQDNSTDPAPCSSEYYSLLGKCGGAEHAYLRCPQGYYCSQWGYCGNAPAYIEKAICPPEKRDDPEQITREFSPDDLVQDYIPQDDTEGEELDKIDTESRKKNCQVEKFHKWGKCGTVGHGNFRCRYGEWCNSWGYCSKFAGAAKNAVCPKESRPNPETIAYELSPDDDPAFYTVPPVSTNRSA